MSNPKQSEAPADMSMGLFPRGKIPAIVAVLLITVLVGLFALDLFRSPSAKSKIEHWLGTRLPSSASDFHYWYDQPPGYYYADLIARFKLPREDFILLMKNLGIRRVEDPTSIGRLPTNFNTDPTVTWWNPPNEQPECFFLRTNYNITVHCLWHDGYIYIEKEGGFGGMWNWKGRQKE